MSEIEQQKKRVSFSQYSTYIKCPHKWELDYLKNMRVRDDNINTTFGTAIHHAIQTYLTELFTNGLKSANNLDSNTIFINKFKEEFKKIKEPPAEEDFNSFCEDGKAILAEIFHPMNLNKYFSIKKYSLVGIEIPLNANLINNLEFVGFIDVVLKEKDSDKYKIIDIKTSTNGWNKYMQEDEAKYVQLHLYKHVYSKKFNIPEKNIEIEFFIVKRKLYEHSYFNKSRIQTFSPTNAPKAIKESITNFVKFLDEAFTKDGNYNEDKIFPQCPGERHKNCKFCLYYKNQCDGKPT